MQDMAQVLLDMTRCGWARDTVLDITPSSTVSGHDEVLCPRPHAHAARATTRLTNALMLQQPRVHVASAAAILAALAAYRLPVRPCL